MSRRGALVVVGGRVLQKRVVEMSAQSVVTIEGAIVDYISDLSQETEQALSENAPDGMVFRSVTIRVGGTGVQFATAAKRIGFRDVAMIGKVGGYITRRGRVTPDLPGRLILQYLRTHHVRPFLAIDPNTETGRSLIVFLPASQRLMITDGLANASFRSSDITSEMIQRVLAADLVHTSGYGLLHTTSREAILDLIAKARSTGAYVALDLVPHKFYKYMSLQELHSTIGGLTDCIFVDIATAHQLLGLGLLDRDRISHDLIQEVTRQLARLFPCVALGTIAGQMIVTDRSGQHAYASSETIPTDADQRGYTSRVQAEFLFSYLNR